MLLLAADTSGKNGSIALAQAREDGTCDILEVVPLQGGTFSAQLVPQIAALLGKHGFNQRDIGGFAVASGPGSFTGLRVGLAAIKALAEVLRKPIAMVSLLEAVAAAGNSKGKVLSALDAGRNEIYAGEYETEPETKLIKEQLLSREEFLAIAAELPVTTPDLTIAEMARKTGSHVEEIARPRSDAVAGLGWQKIQAGETVLPEDLEANYLRRSDAEIFSKSGSQSSTGDPLLIRLATANDIPALMALDRSSATAAHWSREQYEQAVSSVEPRRVIFLVEEDGAIYGLLGALRIIREWEIENLVITDKERQRGLGNRLIKRFLELARQVNAAAVFLEVRESNAAARRLYEKAGFDVTSRRKNYYREPEEDALVYRLTLI